MRPQFAFAAAAALFAAPASAQQPAAQRPQVLTRVLDCRSIQAAAERLACFDREVAAMQAAEASRELVVVDRQQLRRARRSVFGLVLPDLELFSGGDDEDEGVSQIESTISRLSRNPYGKYTFILPDGARWIQIDSRELGLEPRVGQPIRIRRAAGGSYLANVNQQVAIRVRRER